MLITKIRTTMEFAKDSMGQPDNYFYAPQFAWQNPDRPSVSVYKDSKCTQVVPAEYMKYHFEELYTFEIDDKGNIVGDLASQAAPTVEFEAGYHIHQKPIRGTLPLTFRIRDAVQEASPSICLLVKANRLNKYFTDLVNEFKFLGLPMVANESRLEIKVGLSRIHVCRLEAEAQDTFNQHAGMNYTTIVIDEPVVLNHKAVGKPSVTDFMLTRLRQAPTKA